MERWFVRHGAAEEPDAARWPDDRQRPLSPGGRADVERLGRRLARVAGRPEAIWASPYRRARETAELLAETAGWPAPTIVDELAAEADPRELFERVRAGPPRLALVGHAPLLPQLLAGWLGCPASDRLPVRLVPGAVAYVEGEPGAAALHWLLTPSLLP